MLVGLKLKAAVSIYGHMPYNFYRTFSSTAAPTTNFPVVPTHIYRCRRISTPVPAFLKVSVFSCQKEKEEYAPFSVRNISTTGMGYTPGNKKDHHREKTLRSSSSSSAPSKSAKLLTLPTILTIGRVAAIPVLVTTFYVDSWWGPTATTGIFIAAAITDWLDGYLARKMNLGTAFGAFLDPVADKVFSLYSLTHMVLPGSLASLLAKLLPLSIMFETLQHNCL
uniref:Cdp-diacylglycerol--glycerol-3-phosphate 3-phosphatidyltransferase n=1 Tax=Solanum tuberosum TaxID=4113 RepID=M1D5Z6_SOLTU